jgi:hypothetical protein
MQPVCCAVLAALPALGGACRLCRLPSNHHAASSCLPIAAACCLAPVGRLSEVERRVRAVDEHWHKLDQGAAVVDLAARLGSLEDSVTHLATSDGGIRTSLGSLQAAVGQLKTAVVALELRPPLADAAASGADCLQVLSGGLIRVLVMVMVVVMRTMLRVCGQLCTQ